MNAAAEKKAQKPVYEESTRAEAAACFCEECDQSGRSGFWEGDGMLEHSFIKPLHVRVIWLKEAREKS